VRGGAQQCRFVAHTMKENEMVARMGALLALGAVCIAGCDLRPRLFGSLFGDDGCTYQESTYSHGSAVCQSGSQYRCNDGQWKGLGIACADDPRVAAKSCGSNGNSYSPGSAICQSGTQYRCDDGVWKNLVVACRSGELEARMAPDGRSCMYNEATVATQSTICKSGTTFRCEDGEWRNLGTACR
jgi:hypothetical protein